MTKEEAESWLPLITAIAKGKTLDGIKSDSLNMRFDDDDAGYSVASPADYKVHKDWLDVSNYEEAFNKAFLVTSDYKELWGMAVQWAGKYLTKESHKIYINDWVFYDLNLYGGAERDKDSSSSVRTICSLTKDTVQYKVQVTDYPENKIYSISIISEGQPTRTATCGTTLGTAIRAIEAFMETQNKE